MRISCVASIILKIQVLKFTRGVGFQHLFVLRHDYFVMCIVHILPRLLPVVVPHQRCSVSGGRTLEVLLRRVSFNGSGLMLENCGRV